jgi:hypothetical protein
MPSRIRISREPRPSRMRIASVPHPSRIRRASVAQACPNRRASVAHPSQLRCARVAVAFRSCRTWGYRLEPKDHCIQRMPSSRPGRPLAPHRWTGPTASPLTRGVPCQTQTGNGWRGCLASATTGERQRRTLGPTHPLERQPGAPLRVARPTQTIFSKLEQLSADFRAGTGGAPKTRPCSSSLRQSRIPCIAQGAVM